MLDLGGMGLATGVSLIGVRVAIAAGALAGVLTGVLRLLIEEASSA